MTPRIAHRPLELAGPDLAEAPVVVGRVHVRDDDLAQLAAGARHEDHAMPGLDGLGHRPAGPDGLVVGMGVDGHEGRAMARGRRSSWSRMLAQPGTSGPCRGSPGIGATLRRMIDRIAAPPAGRRSRGAPVEAAIRPAEPDEVAFVAYGEDCILSGRTDPRCRPAERHAQRRTTSTPSPASPSSGSTTGMPIQVDEVVVAARRAASSSTPAARAATPPGASARCPSTWR